MLAYIPAPWILWVYTHYWLCCHNIYILCIILTIYSNHTIIGYTVIGYKVLKSQTNHWLYNVIYPLLHISRKSPF